MNSKEAFFERNRRTIFYILLIIAFLMILIYNFLTPILSDDFMYRIEARQASSFWDLLKQQYGEYLSNNGRFFGQLNIRIFLYPEKWIFNFVNSLVFLILTILIYINTNNRKKYDIYLYLLILLLVWRYTVSFGQTMLWICGSCNYLWGTTIILGLITIYRYILGKEESRGFAFKNKRLTLLYVILLFFYGIWAGMCNENTSGGGILILLIFLVNHLLNKEKKDRKIRAYMLSPIFGMCTGLLLLITAPGVKNRAAVMTEDENFSGILKYMSRFYKLTVYIRENYFELLCILLVVMVILVIGKSFSDLKKFRNHNSIIFSFAAIATIYALVMAPTPQVRTFFGAGVFLMIALTNGIMDISYDEKVLLYAKYGLVCIFSLWLIFDYFENTINLARILREENERIECITEAVERGDEKVVVAKYRPEFVNRYTIAYDTDMEEDYEFWSNGFYERYFDIGNISAIPRDEWNSLYGEKE